MARSVWLCLGLFVAVAESGIITKDLYRIQDLESRDACEVLDRFDGDTQCKGSTYDVFSVDGHVITMADTGTVCRALHSLDFFACKGGLWVQVPLSYARTVKRKGDQHRREKRFLGAIASVVGIIGGVVPIACTFMCNNGAAPNTFPQIDCPYVGPQFAKTGDKMVVTWTEPKGTDKEDGSLSPTRYGLPPGSEFIAATHVIRYRVVDSGGLSADCEIMFSVNISGNWGEWPRKTQCSASCGGGTRPRSRRCDSPPPDEDDDTCECNVDACPECPTLHLSTGNVKNCTESDGYTRCTITCRGDMVFSQKPLPVYECGSGSNYVWNHQEHKSNARPPACVSAEGATRYDVTHTVIYPDLPCTSGNGRSEEVKSQVSESVKGLMCVQRNACTAWVAINSCRRNAANKQSKLPTVVSILISTTMTKTESLDLTEFVENNVVTAGHTNYLNKVMKTEFSIQSLVNRSKTLLTLNIDGATYLVATDSMSTTTVTTCPSGTTATEGVCGQCPAGSKEVNGKCELCEKGSYQQETASTSCRVCPSGTTTHGVGADDGSQCTDSDEEKTDPKDKHDHFEAFFACRHIEVEYNGSHVCMRTWK